MMRCKFNMNLCTFTSVILAVTVNFVLAPTPDSTSENTFEINTRQEFQDKVLNNPNTVITQFHAPWCAPCKGLSPILEDSVNQHNGKIKLARVDVASDKLQDLVDELGIRNVPMMTAYKSGKVVDSMLGFTREKEVQDFVDKQSKE